MKTLIVYAHPNPASFSHAIMQAAAAAARERGDEVTVRDLYALGFDPVLRPADFLALKNGQPLPDVAEEQRLVAAADRIVVVYPLWWTGLPAILKGYFDRVFSHGFAYAIENGAVKQLLAGKKALLLTTHGTPTPVYESSSMFPALRKTSDTGIFVFCGIMAEHRFFGAVPYVDNTVRQGWLDEVRQAVLTL